MNGWLGGAMMVLLLAAGCAQGSSNSDTGISPMDSSVVDTGGGGECSPVCGPTQACRLGRCRPRCDPDGTCSTGTCCEGACITINIDPIECGACGNTCAPEANMCIDGVCHCGAGPACGVGETCCGAACVNLSDSVDNCGACGVRCASGAMCIDGDCVAPPCPTPCAPGEMCVDGACRCGSAPACGGGRGCCGDVCIDTLSDSANCGSCDTACPSGQMCVSGTCTSDIPCPTPCPVGEVCDMGVCRCGAGATCPSGQSCCSGVCATTNTEMNCGVCGAACSAGQRCCGGICTDVTTNVDNCGACGADCGSNADSCVGGGCRCGSGSACATFPVTVPCVFGMCLI